jgi:hypothetical protein
MVQIASGLMLPVSSLDHIVGPIEEPMQLVERGAYECPQCGVALPDVVAVAEAAGRAGVQDRFRAMHGRLFDRRLAVDQASLAMYLHVMSLAPASRRTDGVSRTG